MACIWTNNNLSCINTWAFLRALGELKAIFKNAGDLTMDQLAFWNPLDSAEARRTAAMALASQLDRMFIMGLRAEYEPNFNRTKAVTAMTDILVQKPKTVCELAEAVNEAYRFAGEKM